MGLVTVTQINPNDEITAAGANLPHNQIAEVINGHLDADNLADAAVTTPKIVDEAVTTQKIDDEAVTSAKVATGMPVQMVSTTSSAVATTTTSLPFDDTIPQNTEGAELMTLSITPKSATNTLVIEVTVMVGLSAESFASIALFKDTGADAIAANGIYIITPSSSGNITIRHTMTAGSTSATTFKVRGGPAASQTFTFNGVNSARRFGAVTKSSIVITEYKS